MTPSRGRTRGFTSLALTTALMTLGLIVFGAVVRVTDSGLGCGSSWPLCDGRWIPPLDNMTAWIEWLHRLFAALIGLLGIGMLLLTYRGRTTRVVRRITVAAAAIFAFQAGLGALVVIWDLPPTMVTLHLGTAMLLLGALLWAGLASFYRPKRAYAPSSVTTLVVLNTVFTLVIILTGALVRGSGATLACLGWPFCNGQWFPLQQGQLALVHMLHRYAVLALGVSLVVMLATLWTQRPDALSRAAGLVALGMYLAQALVGMMFVLQLASPVWGAAHVGMAAAMWGAMVVLCVLELNNSRAPALAPEGSTVWQPHSQGV